ncbi:hypothetical protein FF100_03015 [Methylobacterium terricola]|uniref:Uncharacterized protein n=1 Tax=Methylobacterium terricola TaxID=2583531 RepID=A0A5C4LPT4_9HYPH|nr:hypothetical protein FF100_03015 [Methylobacterium terricola]
MPVAVICVSLPDLASRAGASGFEAGLGLVAWSSWSGWRGRFLGVAQVVNPPPSAGEGGPAVRPGRERGTTLPERSEPR